MNSALSGQWADSLLSFERLHLLKLLVWALLSITAGTALIALQRIRRQHSPLLTHFAIQSVAWGLVDAAIVGVVRDYAGAVALDRFVWLNIGLDGGYVAVGLTLALLGWRLDRRFGLVGAGLGITVQGLALVVLDLQLAATILR